jgi:hypothetical protein
MSDLQTHTLGGLVTTPEEAAYELRAAEGALWTGGRLVMAMFAMAFAAMAFAYFYLRSSNSDGLWRPHEVTAPEGVGGAIVGFTIAAAVVAMYGIGRLRRGALLDWEVATWAALACSVTALGLQAYEFADLPFPPGSSGYASCFIGWSVLNCGILFAASYWTETTVVRHLRLRRAHVEEGGDKASVLMPRITRISLVTLAHFLVFTAVIGVFFWIFFYLAG